MITRMGVAGLMVNVIVVLVFLFLPERSQGAPNLVNYQGELSDSGGAAVPDDTYTMIFRVFEVETDGTPLWEESQSVVTVNGIYNVLLGSGVANTAYGAFDALLFSGDDRWLEVEVNGERLTPRQRIVSVAYALRAGTATTVLMGSITSESIAPGAITSDKIGIDCAIGEVLMRTASGWECIILSGVPSCSPGDFRDCYSGPEGTRNIGPCRGGTRACNETGSGFDACIGDIPPAIELCDGIDNDCNGVVDDTAGAQTWYADSDGDGYGDANESWVNCNQPVGYVADSTDCDDTDSDSYPGAWELCNGQDNDCDGVNDNSCVVTLPACTVAEFATFNSCNNSCGADVTCMNNCLNGQITDECFSAYQVLGWCMFTHNCQVVGDDCTLTFCKSEYDTLVGVQPVCIVGDTQPCGTDTGECQSGIEDCPNGLWSGICAGEIGPVPEICGDGLDNDCNGTADDTITWYLDSDGDGFGDLAQSTVSCNPPAGYVDNPDDCDDANEQANPLMDEMCDGIDNNCDGSIDEYWSVGDPCTVGIGACEASGTIICLADGSRDGCSAVAGTPTPEICDGLDNNCDGTIDEACCATNNDCTSGEYCAKNIGDCSGSGFCQTRPVTCPSVYLPVCGCDGLTYANQCEADLNGVVVDSTGECVVPDGTPCDDGNPCTAVDLYSAGVCTGTPYSCDDTIPCTTDTCNGDGTCSNTIGPSDCLIDGVCYFAGELNPSNACQACESAWDQTNWSNLPNTVVCDYGDACTSESFCDGLGSCSAGTPYICDDDNPCTSDSCDPSSGCIFEILTGNSCDDGNDCTINDICGSGGGCTGVVPDEICGDAIDNNCNGQIDERCLDDGETCTGHQQCASGSCVDNVCCNSACAGTCLSCDGGSTGIPAGECGSIVNGMDPNDECTGATACNGAGGCWAGVLGTACASDYECLSGFCVDGVCCRTACDGLCASCDGDSTGIPAGECGFITNGMDPNDECAGSAVCDGLGACTP